LPNCLTSTGLALKVNGRNSMALVSRKIPESAYFVDLYLLSLMEIRVSVWIVTHMKSACLVKCGRSLTTEDQLSV
jgi:hypothetical protein